MMYSIVLEAMSFSDYN